MLTMIKAGSSNAVRLFWALLVICFVFTGPLYADDTAIYGCGSVSVEPNILIVFDTSGSMATEDVPGEYYEAGTSYSGAYTVNAVYQEVWETETKTKWVCTGPGQGQGPGPGQGNGSNCAYQTTTYYTGKKVWELFADSLDDLDCTSVEDALESDGITYGDVYDGDDGYGCGGSQKHLSTGNYLNYDAGGYGEKRSRIDVAKEVIQNLVRDTDGVRFGLMRFNYNNSSNTNGGRVIVGIDSVDDEDFRSDLITAIGNLPASGNTPLAETLAEAGLYFAGDASWYNQANYYSDDILTTSNTYTSPMQYRCQKNYIILMTDGAPTQDNDWRLKSQTYINGDVIGDYDNDDNSGDSTYYSASDYLDDVAAYLYQNDCNPELGEKGDTYETQRIITYTIGFKTSQTLLLDAAENGGGEYYTVNSISGLTEAFESIISQIKEANASYVAPVIPVSSMNYAYSGSSIYLGFFSPTTNGRWYGNLKKFGLDNDGNILDVNGNAAIDDDGSIYDSARSYWSSTKDGGDVTAGGLGERLLDNASRNLYTYLGTTTNLTDSTNRFALDNDSLTYSLLGVSSDAKKEEVISDIIATSSSWKMGDVVHSTPAVSFYENESETTSATDYDNGAYYIFVGTNGGMLHAFKDDEGQEGDGSEVWAFIPRPQIERLKKLSDNDTTHDYFVDGAPVIYSGDSHKILFYGERRGGYHYYGLDITDPETPIFLYTIDQSILADTDSNNDGIDDGSEANLGQSWSTPSVQTIKTSGSTAADVFLVTGGYDENQDQDTPEPSDTVGKNLFTVQVTSGQLTGLNFNPVNAADMTIDSSTPTHCFVDAMGFDSNSDGYTNRIYAGDLNGNIWAFEDDEDGQDEYTGGDGAWSGRKLFSAKTDAEITAISQDTATDSAKAAVQRKIFYAPDVVLEKSEDMIFFGTGDRADPEKTAVVNRIYGVRNNWSDKTEFATLTEDDLVDVTDNLIQTGTQEEQDKVKAALDSSRGWFFKLPNEGEKIVSSVIVFNKILYFTTYTPESDDEEDSETDPCGTISGLGTSRLYAVDYENGSASMDFDEDATTYDRSKTIGSSIASSPVIAILPGGAKIYIGDPGGIETVTPVQDISMHKFFWRQAFP